MKRTVVIGAALTALLGVLAALAWLWLSLPERSVGHLLATVAVGVVIFVGVLLWQGLALRLMIPGWFAIARLALWNVLAIAALTAVSFAPLAPEVIVPVYFAIVAVAAPGINHAAGGMHWLRALTNRKYWVAALIWLAVGVYFPYRLIWWVPAVQGMTAQSASAAVRFFFAALIFVASAIALGHHLRSLEPDAPAPQVNPRT